MPIIHVVRCVFLPIVLAKHPASVGIELLTSLCEGGGAKNRHSGSMGARRPGEFPSFSKDPKLSVFGSVCVSLLKPKGGRMWGCECN